MFRFLLTAATILIGQFSLADETEGRLRVADDVFLAGQMVQHTGDAADDLFIAGENLRVIAPVTGSALMAGRRIDADGDIAGDVYAAGVEVTIDGTVGGDASIFGYDVRIGPVAGDLRASGSRVSVAGTIGGYALLAAEDLKLDGEVAGDAHLTARDLTFGPAARVEGQLVLYEAEPGALEVPERVASADRIDRREMQEWRRDMRGYGRPSWGVIAARFVLGLIVVALLAGLAAALLPEHMAHMRRRLLEAPWRALWLGFLTQSAVIGSGILIALTVIGLFFTPAMILLTGLLGLAGYIVGVYAFGVGLLHMLGRPFPTDWRDRGIAAAVGAVTAGVLGLIPFLGWLFVLALTLTGVGAITMHLVRPRFFVGAT